VTTTRQWTCPRCLPDGSYKNRDDIPCFLNPAPCKAYEVYVVPVTEVFPVWALIDADRPDTGVKSLAFHAPEEQA
jgi:hypothetical protein